MANSYAQLQTEIKERVDIVKSAFNFALADRWYSTLTAAGVPDPGTSSISVQSTGALLSPTTAGFPRVATRSTGSDFVTFDEVTFAASIAPNGPVVRAKLLQAHARYGTYAFNANTVVTDVAYAGPPWYSGYLWAEIVTAVTGSLTVTVTTRDAGVFTLSAISAPAAGTFWRFPKNTSNFGSVLDITRVQGSGASAGSFNLWLVEPLWSGAVGPGLPQQNRVRHGLNEITPNGAGTYGTFAILPLVRSTAAGAVPLEFELVTSLAGS